MISRATFRVKGCFFLFLRYYTYPMSCCIVPETSGDITPFDAGKRAKASATVVKRSPLFHVQRTRAGLRRAGADRSVVIEGSGAEGLGLQRVPVRMARK